MDLALYSTIGVLLYVLALIFIGWLKGRSQSHEGFVIGARSVGTLATAASIAVSWRDVAYTTFWLSMAYANGWGLFTVYIGSVLSLTLVSRAGLRFRDIGAERNYVTPGQMLEDYIGPYSRRIYSGLILFIGVLFGAAQLFVMGTLLSSTLNWSPELAMPVVALVVAFYLWRGGYGSVILTDIIQFMVIIALVLVPFVLPPSEVTIYDLSSFGSLGWAETAALIIFPFFWNIPGPDIWQRVYSARDESVVKRALPLGAVGAAALTFALVFLGIYLRAPLPDADPSNLFALIFTEQVFSPYILSALLVVIFAMGMSTLDTWTFIISSTVLRDFVGTSIRNERDSYISYNRWITVVFLVLVTVVALSFDDLLSLLMGLMSSYAIAAPLFYVVMFRLLKPSALNDKVLVGIVLLSFVLYVYMHFMGLFGTSFVKSIIPVALGMCLTMTWALIVKIKSIASR